MNCVYLIPLAGVGECLPARAHVVDVEVVRQLAGSAGVVAARVQRLLEPRHHLQQFQSFCQHVIHPSVSVKILFLLRTELFWITEKWIFIVITITISCWI